MPIPQGAAPVRDDPTTSEYMLRILCARWNKYNNLEDCHGRTLIVQAVMNPRTRLWGAAVTYALVSNAGEIDPTVAARFDPARNAAVFTKQGTNRAVLIGTNDGVGEMDPAPTDATDLVYRVDVSMYTGRANPRTAAQRARRAAITDYHSDVLNVDVSFSRLPD